MVVDNFDLVGVTIAPAKANPPLAVDANAVLTSSIASQYFQTVAGRAAQVVEPPRSVQVEPLATGRSFKRAKLTNIAIIEELLRVFRCKRPDHEDRLLRIT